jgi:hypothetical protein
MSIRTLVAVGTAALIVTALGSSGAQAEDPEPADRRALPGDITGDGYVDLLVGAPGERLDDARWRGSVTLLRGGGSTGVTATGAEVITREQAVGGVGVPSWQCWPRRLAVGDFNGDGFGDVIASDPCEGAAAESEESSLGSMVVLSGSATGLRRWGIGRLTWRDLGIDGAELDPFLGDRMAVGDFDGDGQDDLATGIRGAFGPERLWVLRGLDSDATLLASRPSQALTDVSTAMVAGDVNGDGTDDLVQAGWYPQDDDEPRPAQITVRLGTPEGIGVPVSIPTPEAMGTLGQGRLALGDFDGDGRDDLAAAGESQLLVFRGTPTGLAAAPTTLPAGGVATLAVGDFDGDAHDDLALGRPDTADAGVTAAGRVDVLFGGTTGLSASGRQGWGQATAGVPGAAERNDRFGAFLFAGNLGHSARDDLVVAAPGENGGAGGVTVLYGTANGLTRTYATGWTQATAGVPGASERDDVWGILPG